MIEISPENVSGFVVGEGCFYVESGFDKKYKLKHRIRPAFCIEVKAEDREILEAIRDILGCGKVYELDFGRYQGYQDKKWKPHVKYRVSNQADLIQKVVPFFEKYPLFGKKLEAFKVFKEILKGLSKGEQKTPQGLENLKKTANQLKTVNKKGI
ncbi:MAG: LAGLIDADG family homing endonuclease [Armatimonadota bacterium]